MARWFIFFAAIFSLLALIQAACPTEARVAVREQDVSTEEIKYSRQVYYELLLALKEESMLKTDLENCPRNKCFADGTCLDLCDSGLYP